MELLEEIIAKLHQLSENVDNDDQLLEDILSEEELEVIYENFEQLDELSKQTLKSYISKAATALDNRYSGIAKAADKLTKRGIYQKTKDKKAAVNESEGSDTLVPNSRPGDTKSQVLSSLLSLTPNMSIEDLTDLYNQAVEITGKVADVSDESSANRASISMKEDITEIFSGEDLTESVKDKIAVIFESAVNVKSTEAIVAIEEAYNEALEEELAELEEALLEKLDAYLEHMADDFINENQIAIESTLKSELAEDFINGLKSLFEEHYIDIPESKVDVVEALSEKVAELEEAYNNIILENSELKDNLIEAAKSFAIEEAVQDLPVTHQDKFRVLAENLEFADNYQDKLDALKTSSVFKKAPAKSNILTEDFISEEVIVNKSTDPAINSIAKSLNRSV